jgi:hypothetical protein
MCIRNSRATWRYGLPVLLTIAAADCRLEQRATVVDPVPAYAAALSAPGLLRYRHRLALERHLMSDSATYEASGRLPDTVVAYLLSHEIVTEVCAPLDSSNEVPRCQADSAGGELRLSRPIPLGDTAVVIFVGQGSRSQQGDTSWTRYLGFATTHKCRVAREGPIWKVRRCDLHMIT